MAMVVFAPQVISLWLHYFELLSENLTQYMYDPVYNRHFKPFLALYAI